MVGVTARLDNVVATRTLPLARADEFARELIGRGWSVRIERPARDAVSRHRGIPSGEAA